MKVFLTTLAIVISPGIAVCQEVFEGHLSGNCTGLRNQPVMVELTEGDVKGHWINATGSTSRFEGKMSGSSFKIDRPGVRGESALIAGTREGDTIKFRHEQTRCSYTSTLKKKI